MHYPSWDNTLQGPPKAMKASFNTVLSSEDDFTVCKFDTFLDLIFTPNKDRLKRCHLLLFQVCKFHRVIYGTGYIIIMPKTTI